MEPGGPNGGVFKVIEHSLRSVKVALRCTWWSLLTFGVGYASGWQECNISSDDQWRLATERTPALKMRQEFERRYTCKDEAASFLAASYFFDSSCTGKAFFFPRRVLSCLEGRRVVFFGDSVSVQQADSLVGMLGWHPAWIKAENYFNAEPASGTRVRMTILDCWRYPAEEPLDGMPICWDLYARDFPPNATEGGRPTLSIWKSKKDEVTPRDRNDTSVHVRDYHLPSGDNWFSRAVQDFNETRGSDVFVVNFGAHYPETPEGDEDFNATVFPILDEMAKVGKTATVVWREIAPVHFPSPNASYENYEALEPKEKVNRCCTGTPPRVFYRNQWVENYLRDNGLMNTVKVLRIYGMSLPRGSAHATCYLAPPSTMDEGKRERAPVCHGKHPDCRHWSATGVVEEWNALLLHHLCPAM